MRLIDADALKNELSDKDYITYTHEYGDAIPVNWIMNAIDNAPTEERPTGKWEWVQYDANPNIGNWHCSECRYIPHGKKEYQKTNFCPNCGADMRKEEEND